MENLIYKIKSKLYRYSTEGKKLARPAYKELIKYQNFKKSENNKLAISFGAGRSGMNWFSKIFNSHSNWIGSCERFADYEAFYRYVSYYKLPINLENFYKLFDLASKKDMSDYQNSFISSPYLSFGVSDLSKKLNANYIFFHLRNPIETIQSFYTKGWYLNFDDSKIKSPLIDISNSQYRSFSRIVPDNEFLEEWLKLSRIGKITWFWAMINKSIYNEFNNERNLEKFFVKLEDVNQNYNIYERLHTKFRFENKLTKRQFYDVINKAPNKGPKDNYIYKDWNDLEKREFEIIINKFFPFYDEIRTNI